MFPHETLIIAGVVLFVVLIVVPLIVQMFLRNVDAGTIRIVTLWGGRTHIYRGPGKSMEVPLFTNGTTLSSKAINVDLDITDQTADLDRDGTPQPIKVRILASAIVSVGDTDALTRTAANRYFAKPEDEQLSTLTDLLSSSGPAGDQSAHARSALLGQERAASGDRHRGGARRRPAAPAALPLHAESGEDAGTLALRTAAEEDDDDPLAIIIRKACSRELTDLGLIFNSLNIKVVQSEVAEARRRMSAAEADGECGDRRRAAGLPRAAGQDRGRALHLRQQPRTRADPRLQCGPGSRGGHQEAAGAGNRRNQAPGGGGGGESRRGYRHHAAELAARGKRSWKRSAPSPIGSASWSKPCA